MTAEPEHIDTGMTAGEAERVSAWLLCVTQRLGVAPRPGLRVLELGCGNGEMVHSMRNRGLEAFGCDLEYKAGEHTKAFHEAGWINRITLDPYRLPFEDASFDLVVSVSVLEHVMNVPETVDELARITRPGGAGLHIFPARYRLIEPHTFVPLGTVLRKPVWLRLWSKLGVRNSFQVSWTAEQVATANHDYLRSSTNYLSGRAIRNAFATRFARVEFCEDVLVGCGAGSRSRKLGLAPIMRRSRIVRQLYSACRERALWVGKA